jgi:hypothetical protein
MRSTVFNSIRGYFRTANRWLLRTPERALNEAYEAALSIKNLEDSYFNGERIFPDSKRYGRTTQNYFQSELKKNLDIIKLRMIEFRASRTIVRLSNQSITEVQLEESTDLQRINVIDRPGAILKKLRFIDEILSRYESRDPNPASVIVVADANQFNGANGASMLRVEDNRDNTRDSMLRRSKSQITGAKSALLDDPNARKDARSITDKTGVLPRSILETVDRIKRELDPEAEQEVVRDFRRSKARTIISMRLILFLIIIPLLTQQVTKSFVVGPLVEQFRGDTPQVRIFLNDEMEEEALAELQKFEQRLRFEILIGEAEPRSRKSQRTSRRVP